MLGERSPGGTSPVHAWDVHLQPRKTLWLFVAGPAAPVSPSPWAVDASVSTRCWLRVAAPWEALSARPDPRTAREGETRRDRSSRESWPRGTLACPAPAPGSRLEQPRAAPDADVGSLGGFSEPIDSPPATASLLQALETILQCSRNAVKGLSG